MKQNNRKKLLQLNNAAGAFSLLYTHYQIQPSPANVLTADRLSMSALGEVLSSKLAHAELVPLTCGTERKRVCGQDIGRAGRHSQSYNMNSNIFPLLHQFMEHNTVRNIHLDRRPIHDHGSVLHIHMEKGHLVTLMV